MPCILQEDKDKANTWAPAKISLNHFQSHYNFFQKIKVSTMKHANVLLSVLNVRILFETICQVVDYFQRCYFFMIYMAHCLYCETVQWCVLIVYMYVKSCFYQMITFSYNVIVSVKVRDIFLESLYRARLTFKNNIFCLLRCTGEYCVLSLLKYRMVLDGDFMFPLTFVICVSCSKLMKLSCAVFNTCTSGYNLLLW